MIFTYFGLSFSHPFPIGNSCFFWNRSWTSFFLDFLRFYAKNSDLGTPPKSTGAQNGPQNRSFCQKLLQNGLFCVSRAISGRSQDASGTPLRFFMDFGLILALFRMNFGWIFDRFRHRFRILCAAVSLRDYNDFLEPFWHRIFNFFLITENNENDYPYTVLEGFCLPKLLIVRSFVHRFFMFFSDFSMFFHIFYPYKTRSGPVEEAEAHAGNSFVQVGMRKKSFWC